jgi:hypothetical protein
MLQESVSGEDAAFILQQLYLASVFSNKIKEAFRPS